MKAILVNDDRSLRWDNVPAPVMESEDCLIKTAASHGILYRGKNMSKVVLAVE